MPTAPEGSDFFHGEPAMLLPSAGATKSHFTQVYSELSALRNRFDDKTSEHGDVNEHGKRARSGSE